MRAGLYWYWGFSIQPRGGGARTGTRQHNSTNKSVVTTAPAYNITYHNHNENIPRGL